MKKSLRFTAVLTALLATTPLFSMLPAAGAKAAAQSTRVATVQPAGERQPFVLALPVTKEALKFPSARSVRPMALPSSFSGYSTTFLSNNGPEYLKAVANGSTVHLSGYNPALKNIFASSNTPALGVTKHNLFLVTNGAFSFDITMTPAEGSYPLYFGTQNSDGTYSVLYAFLGCYKQGAWSFPTSPAYDGNLSIIATVTGSTEHQNMLPYSDVVNIIALSDKICAGITDDYAKLRALHDWVAQNIAYDDDAVTNGTIDANGLNTLKNKRGVCGGYSDLYEMLCEAQGLKVYEGIGIAADSADDFPDNPQYGHEWNLAKLGDRWINIDTTWDSGNEYKNATLTQGPAQDVYFDATDDFFAQYHKTYFITKPNYIQPTFDTPVYSTQSLTAQNVTVTVNVADSAQPVLQHTFTKNGTFTFEAADRFGQFTTTQIVAVNNIDKAAPVITTNLGRRIATTGSVTVTVNDPHLASKSVIRDGKRYAWPTTNIFTKKGSYTITAVDSLGNKATKSFKIKK